MRPRATWLRTKCACSMPGSVDVVDVAAVAGEQAGVLARVTDCPTKRARGHADSVCVMTAPSAVVPAALPHGVDDALVAGAAAEVARQRLADLARRSGRGFSCEEGGDRHDEARACRTRTGGRGSRGTPACTG